MLRGGSFQLKTRGSALEYPGSEPFEVIGFTGKGQPGERKRKPKKKAAARKHRKLVAKQKKHSV